MKMDMVLLALKRQLHSIEIMIYWLYVYAYKHEYERWFVRFVRFTHLVTRINTHTLRKV